jgi:5'-deoxynucleotidase YfbR-like HD superfamily hydrolase
MSDNIPVGLNPDNSMDTYSGAMFDPFHPDPDKILIEDIAHQLSLICRFNGCCLFHYSVGQHSLYVTDYVAAAGADLKTQLAALLHDSAEAYLGDWIRPIKYRQEFKALREIEQRLLGVIMAKYGAVGADWQIIRKADNAVVSAEAKLIMMSKGKQWQNLPDPYPAKIHKQLPRIIELDFYDRFNAIKKNMEV